MAEAPPDGYLSVDQALSEIARQNENLLAKSGKTVSVQYRCITCKKLATEHRDGNVKGCREKPLSKEQEDAQISSLLTGVTHVTTLMNLGEQYGALERKLELQVRLADREREKIGQQSEQIKTLTTSNEDLELRLN